MIQSGHRDYKSSGSVQASCSAADFRFVCFLGRRGRVARHSGYLVGRGAWGEKNYIACPGRRPRTGAASSMQHRNEASWSRSIRIPAQAQSMFHGMLGHLAG